MYAYRAKNIEKKETREKKQEQQKKRKRKIVDLACLAEHDFNIIIGGLDFNSLVRSHETETRNFVLRV